MALLETLVGLRYVRGDTFSKGVTSFLFLEIIQNAQTPRREANAIGMIHFVTIDFSQLLVASPELIVQATEGWGQAAGRQSRPDFIANPQS